MGTNLKKSSLCLEFKNPPPNFKFEFINFGLNMSVAGFNVDSDDYYVNLGLDKKADDAAIRKAYRKASMKLHPDRAERNGLSKEKAEHAFKVVSEAYSVLSDPEKRKTYDMYGKVQPGQAPPSGDGAFGGQFGGMPGGQSFYFTSGGPGGGANISRADADAIFSQFFGSSGGSSAFSFGGMGSDDSDDSEDPFGSFGFGSPGQGLGSLFGMGGLVGIRSGHGRSQRRNAPRPTRAAFNQIPEGATVRVKRVKTRPEVNGAVGKILKFDGERYVVEVVADQNQRTSKAGGVVALKSKNLLFCVDQVQLVDIKSKPHLNGVQARVMDFDDSTGRFTVELLSGTSLSLRPENLIFPNNTPVEVSGLTSVAGQQWNGARGVIVSRDSVRGRYQCQMAADGTTISVKPSNIMV